MSDGERRRRKHNREKVGEGERERQRRGTGRFETDSSLMNKDMIERNGQNREKRNRETQMSFRSITQ